MAHRLLTCVCGAICLLWLAIWLEFNRAPHPYEPPSGGEAVCYGWPHAAYFEDGLYLPFHTDHNGIQWYELDQLGWNLLTLVVVWLLCGFVLLGGRSLLATRALSLRYLLASVAVLAGLLAWSAQTYRRALETAELVARFQVSNGQLTYANSLPEELVATLPEAYRSYQVTLIGIDTPWEITGEPQGNNCWFVPVRENLGAYRFPAHQRLRYLTYYPDSPRCGDALLALEPNCLRVCQILGADSIQPLEPMLASQQNLLSLSLREATVALRRLPPATLRHLQALDLTYCQLEGDLAEPDSLAQLRLFASSSCKPVATIPRLLARLPRLTHVELGYLVHASIQEQMHWLDPCPALTEAGFNTYGDGELQVNWALARGVQCVTGVFDVNAELPSFSEARLRTALEKSPAVVWLFGHPRYDWMVNPTPTLLPTLSAWQANTSQSSGVPLLHTYREQPQFDVEYNARDIFIRKGLRAPVILLFGQHPAQDRLVAALKNIVPIVRVTPAETASILCLDN